MPDTPLVKAVLELLKDASEDERAAVLRHMQRLGLPLSQKAGDVLRVVSAQFTPGKEIRVGNVVAACQAENPVTIRKEVYNALGYLTRRRKIRRVAPGLYEAVVKPETSHAR